MSAITYQEAVRLAAQLRPTLAKIPRRYGETFREQHARLMAEYRAKQTREERNRQKRLCMQRLRGRWTDTPPHKIINKAQQEVFRAHQQKGEHENSAGMD